MTVMTVDVSVSCPDWDADLPEAAGLAERAVRAAAAALPDPGRTVEVSVLLADDALQRRLNRDWRGQDRATNVLAFPAEAPATAPQPAVADLPQGLGDIVLAHGVVSREARRDGKTLADHLSHLVVHGYLHLVGFTHDAAAEAAVMEALEVRVLGGLGIADPYAVDAPPPVAERETTESH